MGKKKPCKPKPKESVWSRPADWGMVKCTLDMERTEIQWEYKNTVTWLPFNSAQILCPVHVK